VTVPAGAPYRRFARHARLVARACRAFIDGARAQGADMVDYGMLGIRHALLRGSPDRLDGVRPDYRVTQSGGVQGIKMVREDACASAGTRASARSAR